MGQRWDRSVERAPGHGPDLGAVCRRELSADRRHQPELRPLGDEHPVAQDAICDRTQRFEYLAHQTRLLADLAKGGTEWRLTVLNAAFRQAPGPVRMPRRLHGRDAHLLVHLGEHDPARAELGGICRPIGFQ